MDVTEIVRDNVVRFSRRLASTRLLRSSANVLR
jgi:hypothetical protein